MRRPLDTEDSRVCERQPDPFYEDAGRVCGLISIICGPISPFLSWIPILGPLVSVAAVVTGIHAMCYCPKRAMGVIGTCTGMVGALASVVFTGILLSAFWYR
jgi:hypothetical protein